MPIFVRRGALGHANDLDARPDAGQSRREAREPLGCLDFGASAKSPDASREVTHVPYCFLQNSRNPSQHASVLMQFETQQHGQPQESKGDAGVEHARPASGAAPPVPLAPPELLPPAPACAPESGSVPAPPPCAVLEALAPPVAPPAPCDVVGTPPAPLPWAVPLPALPLSSLHDAAIAAPPKTKTLKSLSTFMIRLPVVKSIVTRRTFISESE
jgi:hypothetical protein